MGSLYGARDLHARAESQPGSQLGINLLNDFADFTHDVYVAKWMCTVDQHSSNVPEPWRIPLKLKEV